MQKIIILIGPPASGKSTWARQEQEKDKSLVIVNRDSIRDARGTYWIPEQESYISDIEEAEIRLAIKRGLTPIIDATNLNPKTMEKWKNISTELNVPIEEKHFYIPYKEALERDKKRGEAGGHAVGVMVLKRFYTTYYPEQYAKEELTDVCPSTEPNMTKRPAVIFDLDNTIMYRNGRGIYEYEKAGTDTCDPRARALIIKLIKAGVMPIFLTGREITDKSYEAINESLGIKKLEEFSGEYDPYLIVGRQKGDRRKSVITKEELYENFVKDNYTVLAAFDDDQNVVDMYRSKGIFVGKIN